MGLNIMSTINMLLKPSNLCLLLLSFTLLWLPIFKGGNYPGAMSFLILTAAALLLLSLNKVEFNRDKFWLLVWTVFSLSTVFHALVVPHLWGNDRFFSDSVTKELLISIDSRGASILRMIEVWSYFTVMWIVAWRVSIFSLLQVKCLLVVLMFVSAFQALYGFSSFVDGGLSIFGLWDKEYYLTDATGTFVNRNHFAGMLAICWPLVLSALLVNKPLIFPSLPKFYRLGIAVLYSFLLLLALLTAHSRMGIAAAFFGVVVWAFLFLKVGYLHSERKSGKWFLLLGVFFLVLFSIWFGTEDILVRYADLGDGNSRFSVWRAMFNFPIESWLVGISPGAFEDVFQTAKPGYMFTRFLYAHNDYLEFVFEFGVIASLLIAITFAFLLFKQCPRGRLSMRSGGFAAIAAVSLHSIVDFNLQVPASALCAWIAFGIIMNVNVVVINANVRSSKRVSKSKSGNRGWMPRNKREWLGFLRSD